MAKQVDTGRAGTADPDGPCGLPPGLKAALERVFAVDLSGLRLARAPVLATLGVTAAANGTTVLIDSSLEPATRDGRSVLGHEVAHCLQQGAWQPVRVGGGAPLRVEDPELEEAADWAGDCAAAGRPLPPAVRYLARTWRASARTRLSRADCAGVSRLARAGVVLRGGYLQCRKAGATTYYGGDVALCPACSAFTVKSLHELASSVLSVQLCTVLQQHLQDLSGKSEVERTGSASSAFNRAGAFPSIQAAELAKGELSQGYMIGVLL